MRLEGQGIELHFSKEKTEARQVKGPFPTVTQLIRKSKHLGPALSMIHHDVDDSEDYIIISTFPDYKK